MVAVSLNKFKLIYPRYTTEISELNNTKLEDKSKIPNLKSMCNSLHQNSDVVSLNIPKIWIASNWCTKCEWGQKFRNIEQLPVAMKQPNEKRGCILKEKNLHGHILQQEEIFVRPARWLWIRDRSIKREIE